MWLTSDEALYSLVKDLTAGTYGHKIRHKLLAETFKEIFERHINGKEVYPSEVNWNELAADAIENIGG